MSPDTAILITFSIAEAALLLLLLLRRAWLTLPAFCAYIASAMISDITYCVIFAHSSRYYFLCFQVEGIVYCALLFLVLVELVWSVLRSSNIQLFPHAVLLVAASIATVGWALWPIALLIDPPIAWLQYQVIMHFQQTLAMLCVVFFIALVAFRCVLSIAWKDRELQVAAGLASVSMVSILVTLLHARIFPRNYSFYWLDIAQRATYLGVLLYWIFIPDWSNFIAEES
jgi:hypothetical protein